MKALALLLIGFMAGLFAPQYTALSHKSLTLSKLLHIDPIAVVCVVVFIVGVSLLLKKRNGGRA